MKHNKIKNKLWQVMAVALYSVSLCLVAACSDDEDTTPSYADKRLFEPAADDNSPMAQLRRDFKEKTGSYLLYNDTLQKVPNGTDIYGNPIYSVETVDMGYSMFGYASRYVYKYEYITDFESQRKAAELVVEKLASRLGNTMPYSVMLVKGISTWEYVDGILQVVDEPYYDDDPEPYPAILQGLRCYAISTNGDEAFENDSYFDNMVVKIVLAKLGKQSSAVMEKFRNPVKNIVNVYKDEIAGADFERKYYGDEVAMSLGILHEWNRYFFCTKWEKDLKDYVDVIFSKTEDEIAREYADYPIVLERFAALRSIILDLGVKL